MADIAETIGAIIGQHRRRVFAMEQRKRANLALAAMLRMALGWKKSLPDDERKAINDRALALIKIGEQEHRWQRRCKEAFEKYRKTGDETWLAKSMEPFLPPDDPDYHEWRDVILAGIESRVPFDRVEDAAEKAMAKLAVTLPVWDAFAKDVRGFGAVSLAIIVAEAGDLNEYPRSDSGEPIHKGKGMLWKRMGLAVLGGVRQGGLSKSASKDDWIAHGYNRQRRSRVWNIGDSLIKGNKLDDGSDGFYRAYYLERKAIERAKAEARGLTIAPSAKIAKLPEAKQAEFMSEGHVHRRAQRKMEIRLLTDLWRAWRRDTISVPERDKARLPAAESLIEETPHHAA